VHPKLRQLIVALFALLPGCVGDPNASGETPTPVPMGINPADFVAAVTNAYFPLLPGTTLIYSSTVDGQMRDVTVMVTHDTKVILGVTCTVVHETLMHGLTPLEDNLHWYAQDKSGNVWFFGENLMKFENGQVVTDGSWEAGVDGAQPGFIVKAHPQVGDAYRQEFASGIAEDHAEILSLTESVTVPAGSFQSCLKTKDFSDLDPGVVQNKVYCPDVGQVLTVTVQGGRDREELVSIIHG